MCEAANLTCMPYGGQTAVNCCKDAVSLRSIAGTGRDRIRIQRSRTATPSARSRSSTPWREPSVNVHSSPQSCRWSCHLKCIAAQSSRIG
eukprot:3393951-Prymnesium_polylepis.1